MSENGESYQLYQYGSCPFCVRVRAYLQQAGLQVPLKDTLLDPQARRDLIEGGGRGTVPCLRIENSAGVRWLYESLDIIDYLQNHADQQALQANRSG
jgi:glutathione S-transferase